MKLKFTETVKSGNGKTKTKVLFTWNDVTKKQAHLICANFMQAFIYASKRDLRRPCDPTKQGYSCQTWNYHKEGFSGILWEFKNGKNHIVTF